MVADFSYEGVERLLGVTFRNRSLLLLAFVHRSFWNEHRERFPHPNERLEFLGDSVLSLLIADYLFSHYPDLDEGALSKLRAQLVDASACLRYVKQLQISPFLLLGRGELTNQGRGRESIEADLFEALLGALYLDQGIEGARHFFFSHFTETVDQHILQPQRNWKAELQEWAQRERQATPDYRLLEESGSAHQKTFRVGVWVDNIKQGEGIGASKKEAQIAAAQEACQKIAPASDIE